MHVCYLSPFLPEAEISAVAYADVLWPRPLLPDSNHPRRASIWLGDPNVEDEPRLDVLDDDI
jgi:hypothetical protein